ncbi:MAG: D-glycero-alpha-D-manno-heptose-1,7-bisphosphate 7-phosphatase [Pseudanabaenaceae cyanobacterium]
MPRPAVFLDRDGVLNWERGYLSQLRDLELMPTSAEAVKKLNTAGIFCCLVSNQAGAARGYYDLDHIAAVTEQLQKLLWTSAQAHLDAIYYCTRLSPPAGGKRPDLATWSSWRKPNPGMLVAAAWQYDLDLKHSFMVGDKATDIDLAHNAGCQGILLTSGYGAAVIAGTYQHPTDPAYVAPDLKSAVDWILTQI